MKRVSMHQFKVGIPRALLYYSYYPLWYKFFESLGANVILSPGTNKQILRQGTEVAESEFCLPVKVFYGHVLSLKDKVDTIFIPRVVSVEKKAYTCPKLLGLPDMIRAIDADLPPIMDPTINSILGRKNFYSSVLEVGRSFNKSSVETMKAYFKAAREHKSFSRKLRGGLDPVEAMNNLFLPDKKDKVHFEKSKATCSLKIGVVGHNYNVYDSYITMNLIKRLKKMGVEVVTAEMIPHRIIEKEAATLRKKLFWTYEKEIIGTAFYWLKQGLVDGVINVLAFACGPDSLIQTLLEHEAKKLDGIPLMSIVIDEHTGEAGLITRLEAFVDMIRRKEVVV